MRLCVVLLLAVVLSRLASAASAAYDDTLPPPGMGISGQWVFTHPDSSQGTFWLSWSTGGPWFDPNPQWWGVDTRFSFERFEQYDAYVTVYPVVTYEDGVPVAFENLCGVYESIVWSSAPGVVIGERYLGTFDVLNYQFSAFDASEDFTGYGYVSALTPQNWGEVMVPVEVPTPAAIELGFFLLSGSLLRRWRR